MSRTGKKRANKIEEWGRGGGEEEEVEACRKEGKHSVLLTTSHEEKANASHHGTSLFLCGNDQWTLKPVTSHFPARSTHLVKSHCDGQKVHTVPPAVVITSSHCQW